MHDTTEFEHLLDKAHVVGVYWDDDAQEVRVFVTEKLPESELAPDDIVSNNVPDDVATDVLDAGLDRDADGFEPQTEAVMTDARKKQRPVRAGVSEIHEQSTAATAGHYPAVVVDPTRGNWDNRIQPGNFVRISNNHVYARRNAAPLGSNIRQPSPYDGGRPDDKSGVLVGYVPLGNGVRVDVAARSATPENDSADPFALPDEWPTDVIRENYKALVGTTVRKSGRTSSVTSSTILAEKASIRVSFGDPVGPLTLREQIVTGDMSLGGDSGSPVYTDDGALVGHLFAGSDRYTIVNRASALEEDFGIRLLTEAPRSPVGGGDGDRRVWSHRALARRLWTFLRDTAGSRVSRNVYFAELGRRVDFVVENPDENGETTEWVVEIANTESAMLRNLGYVLAFAAHRDASPLLVVPESLDISPEVYRAVRLHTTVMTDVEAMLFFE